MGAHLLDSSKNQAAIIGAQFEGRVLHEAAFSCQPACVWRKHWATRYVMISVDRA